MATMIELVHRLREAASNASYVSQTPEYGQEHLNNELEKIEYYSKQILEKYKEEQ